jgi:alpha-glucosidase
MIPTVPPRNYVGEQPADPVTFNLYPDDNGLASGTLYEDDGRSPAYKRGLFRRTNVSARREGREFVVTIEKTEGQYNPGGRKLEFVVAGSTAPVRIKTNVAPR